MNDMVIIESSCVIWTALAIIIMGLKL